MLVEEEDEFGQIAGSEGVGMKKDGNYAARHVMAMACGWRLRVK
jgi:hypothetical protein